MREATCGHQPYYAKGVCRKCYDEMRYIPHPALLRETTCGHELHYANGLCAKCYSRSRYDPEKARVSSARSREKNREKRRAGSRRWAEENRERSRELARAWQVANPERVREIKRAWSKMHPEQAKINTGKRRARKAKTVIQLTRVEWRQILEEFGDGCAYCPSTELLQMEHMMPLSRGGTHTADNIVPACGPCNASKATRTPLEWVGR